VEKKYFEGNAVGKAFGKESNLEIIGVTDEFKRSDIEEPYLNGFFFTEDFYSDFSMMNILVRVKPGKIEDFLKNAESEALTVLDPKVWTINIQNSLENMRSSQNDSSSRRRYVGLLIALFILINVLLGVIGILWYNTNLRIHEIGVKRALGATGNNIRGLLILENLFLGGIGLIVVALVFIQIPSVRLTKVEPPVMYLSVLISIVIMILLILLSTWIPASIASKIRPAEALKTE
jgi:putative ABC transport system permease protein